jgi:hypothetical protein
MHTLPRRSLITGVLVLGALGATVASPRAQKGPTVPDLLQKAGDYLVDYSKKMAAVEAEETYTQRDVTVSVSGDFRKLKSDALFLGLNDGTIASFRDVFEADGKPTRGHDDRLAKLFTSPNMQAAVNGAEQLTGQSTSYFLDLIRAAIDLPTLGLEYLKKSNQDKSDFKLDSIKTDKGVQIAVLKFAEHKPGMSQGVEVPPVLQLPNRAISTGRLTIDASTGAVRQTELLIEARGEYAVHARVLVKYDAAPSISVLVPVSMDQTYELTSGGSGESTTVDTCGSGSCGTRREFDCHANYAKFKVVPITAGGRP